MPDTTAKIRAKGLDSTGVTEDLAEQMYATLGRHTIAIVELKHEAHSVTADGSKKVELTISLLEPATDDAVEEHLRELHRTMHQNRALRSPDSQPTLVSGDGIAPKVKDVLAAGAGLKVHDFVLDDSDPEGACEHAGCRKPEDDPIHTVHDELPDPDEADKPDAEDEKDAEDDALEAAEEQAEDAGTQETGDDSDDDEVADQPAAADPGWEDGYPQGATPTRPLSAVPDPFTTPTGTD